MSHYTEKYKHLQALENTGEILSDIQPSGKQVPWRLKKLQGLAIVLAYQLFGCLNYALKIADCGNRLEFATCPKGHKHKLLIRAYFCRCRLCVMCQWRRSRLMFSQLMKVIHAHMARYKSDVPLLLTLTVPNVKGAELSNCLDKMFPAYTNLMKRRPVKRVARSAFRALEVTYNEKRDDYHPHFHVLLMVPAAYFKRDRGLYIERDEWLRLWQESMGMPEITQVDIRRIKGKKGRDALSVASLEVGKYATKPADYIKRTTEGEFTVKPEVIEVLHHALKGRRLISFSGLFYRLRKELNLEDVENADLVKVTDEVSDCHCSICKTELVREVYSWHAGIRNYVAK